MTIRQLEPTEARAFHEFRLAALQESPEAFGSTYEEEVGFTEEQIETRYGGTGEDFILGAFDPKGKLVGAVGLLRQRRIKRLHSAHVWGMYVAPEARGQGISKALLTELIERAKRIEGLEQLDLGLITTGDAARHVYLALGFKSYGIEPRAHKCNGVGFDMEHLILQLR